MIYNVGDVLLCIKNVNAQCLDMTNPCFDIKQYDKYIVTDMDDYPEDNHCHWYELTSKKNNNLVLSAWNDADHMVIDENFRKLRTMKLLSIQIYTYDENEVGITYYICAYRIPSIYKIISVDVSNNPDDNATSILYKLLLSKTDVDSEEKMCCNLDRFDTNLENEIVFKIFGFDSFSTERISDCVRDFYMWAMRFSHIKMAIFLPKNKCILKFQDASKIKIYKILNEGIYCGR